MNRSFFSNIQFRYALKTYALVGLLAVASWGLVELFRFEYPVDDSSRNAPRHSADYFSQGYLRKDLNEYGRLKSELSARTILHYSDDGTTHIDKPQLSLYNTDSAIPPWIIKAEKGILSADGETLLLQGQVFIDRAKATGVRQMNIKTSHLRVQPKISYAESAEWAELVSPPHRTEGKGIQMTFKKPIAIKLLSSVKSRYVLN